MRRHFLILVFFLIGVGANGCGGQVHFVSDKAVVQPPAPPPASRTVTESFRYGQSTGTEVNVFAFYPRKSLSAARMQLVQAMPAFMGAFWNGSDQYTDARFGVVRDVASSLPDWYSAQASLLARPQWPAESLQFVQQHLAQAPIELRSSEADTFSPYETFAGTLTSIAYQLPLSPGPVWVNVFYLRDADLVIGSKDQAHLAQAQKSFLAELSGAPFSEFRTAIHLVSYLTPGGACDPLPDRIARALLGDFDGFSHDTSELCDLSDGAANGAAGSDLSAWGNAVHARDSRLVLRARPDPGTLQVSVAGQPVSREYVTVTDATNEISFREDIPSLPHPGDLIQVSYEALHE